jgi:hypothetical protein
MNRLLLTLISVAAMVLPAPGASKNKDLQTAARSASGPSVIPRVVISDATDRNSRLVTSASAAGEHPESADTTNQSAAASANTGVVLSVIGKGCSTAFFIDKDCDGYGVGIRADGDYTTPGNTGDMADADDDDPAVNSTASVLAKYGSIAAFLAHTGYPATRIWYIAPTTVPAGAAYPPGNDTDCAANGAGTNPDHPCATTAPFRAKAYRDSSGNPGAGGVILYRGGTYVNYGINATAGGPSYLPTAASTSSPIVFIAYPGEIPIISKAGYNFDTSGTDAGYWPYNTGIANVVLDGLVMKSPTGAGSCIIGNDTNNFIFRNLEIVGCQNGIQENNHVEYMTIEGNVFHDAPEHGIYLGISNSTAVPHTLGADFDFDQDAINYICFITPGCTGTKSKGATQHVIIQNNLSYRDGGGGFEAFHINTMMRYLTMRGNIIHTGNNAALSFQTGLYNSEIYNNLVFNNGGCAANFWFYDNGDPTINGRMATMRWVTVENNTLFSGNHMDHIKSSSASSGNPRCGIRLSDGTTTSQPGDHWFKEFTIRNNIIVTDNYTQADTTSAVGPRPFEFLRNSYPGTHIIQNNVISNNGTLRPFNAATDQVMEISADSSVPAVTDGWYTFPQFQAYNTAWTGNIYADPQLASTSLAWGCASATCSEAQPQLFDFRLKSGSPAINAGLAAGAPADDLVGNARTAPPDAGAYEYTTSAGVPVISAFSASPPIISPGGASTLSWSVSSATSVSINQSIGAVSGTSISVSPTTTTIYTLTATNATGSATRTATVSLSSVDSLAAVSGDNQTGTAGQTLSSPLVVVAKDASANPVSGIPVMFAITSGGGSLSTSQAATDASGQASTLLTLGASAGTTVVTATANGLAGSPVTFSATATPPVTVSSGAGTWTQVTPAGPWPAFRGWNRLVYDPVLKRSLLGTSDNSNTIYSNSYWSYDSTSHTWRQETTTGVSGACVTPLGSDLPNHPANRHPYHAQAYDSKRGRMYLFSGVCQGVGFDDTWAFQSATSTWTQLSPAVQPVSRLESAMTYDAAHDVVVLYGGLAPNPSSETWQYVPDSNTWTQVATNSTPGPLDGNSLVYDSINQKVVLFGGVATYGGAPSNGTWIYDAGAKTWTNPKPSVLPPGLKFPPMAFDSKRGLVVLYVGPSEMWAYNVATNQWSRLSVSGGPAAADTAGNPCAQCITMAYDAGTDALILTSQDKGYRTGTWELSLGTAAASAFDLNHDGVVDIVDVQLALEQVIGLAACTTADFNGDGRCTSADIAMIVSNVVGQ